MLSSYFLSMFLLTACSETSLELVADQPVYANTTDQFFSIDPATGERDLIGTFKLDDGTVVDQMTDIAIDNEGTVYGATYDGLYRIDAFSAEVTLVCNISEPMMGMAFTPAGELLAAGDALIRKIDIKTCNSSPVIQDGPYSTSGDIVGLPDGFVYWTTYEDQVEDGLVRIDPVTWEVEYLGIIPVGRLFGVGYAEGKLYGFSKNGETVEIVPDYGTNGVVDYEVIDTDADVSWWGATTNPVVW